MYAEGVLFRDIIFILRVLFVATELPLLGEESPESGYQFPSLQRGGAWLEMLPKHHSQVAYGFTYSARDHWLRTLSFNFSASLHPFCGSKAGNEGTYDEFLSG